LKREDIDPIENKQAGEIKTRITSLIQKNNLHFCLECGKCSAVCPMLEFYGSYVYDRSPRAVVERLSFDPERFDDEALWYCLACQECTFFCPSGVDFQDFTIALRALLLRQGFKKYALFCPICGTYIMPKKEFENFQKTMNDEKIGELLSVCPRCKTTGYVEILHRVAPIQKRPKR